MTTLSLRAKQDFLERDAATRDPTPLHVANKCSRSYYRPALFLATKSIGMQDASNLGG